jgi:hypothetical protein
LAKTQPSKRPGPPTAYSASFLAPQRLISILVVD